MWLTNKSIQKLGGGKLERFGLALWSKLQLSGLNARKDGQIVQLIQDIHRQQKSLLSAFELFYVYSLAREQSRRQAAMAEVGVFQGGSAKLICEAKQGCELRLFDTFSGLPEPSNHDRGVHRQGQYACSLEVVQDYLSGYENVQFIPGEFPGSAAGIGEATYSFVHFEVDLYDGTLGCLEYFYPRMVSGGILLSHDYDILAGVKKAFQEFLSDKPEEIVE